MAFDAEEQEFFAKAAHRIFFKKTIDSGYCCLVLTGFDVLFADVYVFDFQSSVEIEDHFIGRISEAAGGVFVQEELVLVDGIAGVGLVQRTLGTHFLGAVGRQELAFFGSGAEAEGFGEAFKIVIGQIIVFDGEVRFGIIIKDIFGAARTSGHPNQFLKNGERLVILLIAISLDGVVVFFLDIGTLEDFVVFAA